MFLSTRVVCTAIGYDEFLDRTIDKTVHNEGKNRLSVPAPAVRIEGHVTIFENFKEIVTTLNRDADHSSKPFRPNSGRVLGSMTPDARFTGEFRQERLAAALDQYVETSVICSACGLLDTHLVEENSVVQCDACGTRTPL